MAWHPWTSRPKSAAVTARLDLARADLSTSHAAAIMAALAEHDQTGPDAADLRRRAGAGV